MKKLLVFLIAPLAFAQFNKGFDFRASSGLVVDPANCTYVSIDCYPTARNSVTFGWLSAAGSPVAGSCGNVSDSDRTSAIDPRLAGLSYAQNNDDYFEVDLPAAGKYSIQLAIGDATAAATGNGGKIYDGITGNTRGTLLLTVGPTAHLGGQWLDATGAIITTCGTKCGTPVTLTFSTTKLILVLPSATTGYDGLTTRISHLFVSQVTGSVRHKVVSQ